MLMSSIVVGNPLNQFNSPFILLKMNNLKIFFKKLLILLEIYSIKNAFIINNNLHLNIFVDDENIFY